MDHPSLNQCELDCPRNATSAYDNNGNTLTKVVGSNTTTSYTWDFENRLSSVTLPGSGGTVSFKYDPFGRRILRADTLLQSVAVVRITTEDVRELVGESNLAQRDGTPYLLRAVADANGVFPLELDVRPDGTVWAGGGANSKCPVGMRRRPVVVWLSQMPEKIYVTFYVNHD